jgi:hypothetical protein
MEHGSFIFASYAVALSGVLGMMGSSYLGMRRAERQAEALRKRRRGA